jgi:hypothetical protein
LQIVADEEIFLARFADDGCRVDRIAAVVNLIDVENRVVVLQRVVTVVVAERSFGATRVRQHIPGQSKLGFGNEAMRVSAAILFHPACLNAFACEQRGEHEFRHVFR